MFRMKPYNGENSLLLDGASPIITKVPCPDCKGKGYLKDDDDEPVTYNGITLKKVNVCDDCMGLTEQIISRNWNEKGVDPEPELPLEGDNE